MTPADIDHAILEFFKSEHDDGGKKVAAHELLTTRQETIAIGRHSRTRLIEVKKLSSFLQKNMPPGNDELLCVNREPTVDDPPELGLGVFALKVLKKSEVSRLKVQCAAERLKRPTTA